MNVLEKILEEIEDKRKRLIDMSDDEPELCDVDDWYDEGISAGKVKAYFDAEKIIRSHMDEVENDGWIPASERLPQKNYEAVLCLDAFNYYFVAVYTKKIWI